MAKSRSGISRANQNRKIRQDELREYLSARGKLGYIFDNIEKLEDLSQEFDACTVQRIKAATDTRVKMLDKYLPSLQNTTLDGDLKTSIEVIELQTNFGD